MPLYCFRILSLGLTGQVFGRAAAGSGTPQALDEQVQVTLLTPGYRTGHIKYAQTKDGAEGRALFL